MKRNAHGLMRRAPRQAWALAAVALLAFAGAALAQTGGEFGLAWHSVDGGGHTFSTGGAYSLGGSAGQPEAAATPAAGGNYAVQGGFWGPACAPAAALVQAACAGTGGTTLALGWAVNDANMGYDIHRSTAPYFTPDLATKADVTTGHVWLDPAHCGNPAVNHFYVVRATCIGAHADAARVGEFDFALTPGQ